MSSRTEPHLPTTATLWTPYRLSVEQYEAAVASGIFSADDRLELIEGQLVQKMTKGNEHRIATQRVVRALTAILPAGWHLTKEDPVRIPNRRSEPEPDVAVIRGTIDDHAASPPEPSDIGLVVEVSQSSVAADRTLAATYLGGGIPTYWLLNLPDRCLEVFTKVGSSPRVIAEGETADFFVDGRVAGRVAVADLLP